MRFAPSLTIIKRLLPLYIAATLQGFVLWYAIEKLFMTGIGFTPASIGIMAAAYAAMMLLVETPSGILADRWSRKGVLILSGLALAISSFICGISTSVGVFILGAVCWGTYYALYSGTPDSVVYDTLMEETGNSNHYERYYGYLQLSHGLALIAGSLLGGVVGAAFGLKAAFLWTIPIALLSVLFLAIFKEPQLHKVENPQPITKHISDTFRAIAHKGSMVGILIILVLGAVVAQTMMEFDQLWLIAIQTPVVFYGTAGGIVLAAFAFAGPLASHLKLNHKLSVVIITIIILCSGITLTLSHNVWLLASAQALIVITLLAIGIVYQRRLHDRLPSTIRAGASSAVSSMGSALFILTSLVFGWITQHFSVFHAAWLVVVPIAVISIFLIKSSTKTTE